MNIKRLQLLVTLLEEVRDNPKPDMLFNLGDWARSTVIKPAMVAGFVHTVTDWAASSRRPEVLKEGFCGTVACAVGHACLDERFNEQGLSIWCGQPSYTFGSGRRCTSWMAVEKFFGLDAYASGRLFLSSSYPQGGGTDVQVVIDRIVALLTGAENSEPEHSPCP